MIRFALLLLMSFALSSQAVGAVKWNNSTPKEEKEKRQKERDNHWTNNLEEVLGYQSEYIKGINKQQEATINKIGDPLNCIDNIKSINSVKTGELITVDDYIKSPSILQRSLNTNKVTILAEGIYELKSELILSYGRILIGRGNVLLDA